MAELPGIQDDKAIDKDDPTDKNSHTPGLDSSRQQVTSAMAPKTRSRCCINIVNLNNFKLSISKFCFIKNCQIQQEKV